MHFHVNLSGFAALHRACPPPWFWLYYRFLLLVFGKLLRAYVLDFSCLICEILLTSRKVPQKPVAHIQAYVFHGKSTSAELKFLDDKAYLWRNRRRQYFVGPRCSFSGSNIWHFHTKGQIVFKHLLFNGCHEGVMLPPPSPLVTVSFIQQVPYTKQFTLIHRLKAAREMLLYPFWRWRNWG